MSKKKADSGPVAAPEQAPLKEPALIRLRVDQIVPNAGNAREHNHEQLRLLQKSLEHFGIVALPIVQKGSNMLIAGHGRVEALKAAGRTSDVIPCLEVELSDDDAMAYAVTDNRLTDLSSWNLPAFQFIPVVAVVNSPTMAPASGWLMLCSIWHGAVPMSGVLSAA